MVMASVFRQISDCVIGVGISLIVTSAPAWADDAQCLDRFKVLVVDGNPERGAVRIHAFQEVGGSKTENYFYSTGGESGDGMMQPLKNMGATWVLFRDKKMYTSADSGKSWKFVRDMDSASQPEAYKAKVRKDLESADQVACGQEAVDDVMHDTVEGQYKNTALQGAVTFQKYWIRPDSGFISKSETRSKTSGGDFYTLQIIEKAPDWTLPSVE